MLVDLHDRGIVEHAASGRKDARLAKAAFATLGFPLTDIDVFHTNRGSEFANSDIDDLLEAFDIRRPLSRQADAAPPLVVEVLLSVGKRLENRVDIFEKNPPQVARGNGRQARRDLDYLLQAFSAIALLDFAQSPRNHLLVKRKKVIYLGKLRQRGDELNTPYAPDRSAAYRHRR